MKKITLIFLTVTAITVLVVFSSCSHKNSQDLEWIPFIWSSDSLSGRYFEKAAMRVFSFDRYMPVPNKPLAIMAADVKTQTSVLRKNDSDYPQYSLLETATNAIAKTLHASLGIGVK